LNQGELGPDNVSLAKKGRWIINDQIPPLAVPGGCLFVDAATNSVRNLLFNLDKEAFDAEEVSIYSEHLFRTRQFSTWNFQEGIFPLLWTVFNDGTFATFTFEFDQQMKAWTRHDSAVRVRSSCGTIEPDLTFFVVSKVVDGHTKRYIEYSAPRYTPAQYIPLDPEYDKNYSIAYMDSMVSVRTVMSDALFVGDYFSLTAATQINGEDGSPGEDDWSGPLNLFTQSTEVFGGTRGWGAVGDILRYFDPEDGSVYDFEVLTQTDTKNLVVQCNTTFPSANAIGLRLYLTQATFTGLEHLNDEDVSIIVDGAVVASPLNDRDNYPTVTVVAGSLTLPNDLRGAIVHIGRPIVGDIETLDIDTVEQSPTLIESLNIDKLYVKVHNSSGLFVGNKFPANDSVVGMEPLDSYEVNYEDDTPIIGNRAQQAQTKRVELTLPGDWKSQGKVCIRQVDPLHFEVLSIIPDCEILTRSDR
jgi:hypothetical protein